MTRNASFALVTALLAACAHKQQVKTAETPTPVAPAPTTAAMKAPTATATAPRPISPSLTASRDLVDQCKLALDDQARAPKFDFDQFDLLPQDRDALQKIADCVTHGPLEGRSLHLVGRADPRGTDEYNLALGTKRAHAVGSYLEQLGVQGAKLTESTRGALDATGTDETTWRIDRRVDLALGN
ncbi:MAG TPA: OmpA family protein [Kofleriaceae bacterium]|jgi:outer membrane protein OmpA-like peptidoglycan-associated protein|nr:OmpA family protein [Kofleriaceae bacterium]